MAYTTEPFRPDFGMELSFMLPVILTEGHKDHQALSFPDHQ